MIVDKTTHINNTLKILKRKLEENLPEQDFEFEMIEKTKEIIINFFKHLENIEREV